ncbi:hypothetical protein C4577_03555 [Candidatus Parcubacteria bacterium]|nr:MAG: hypothetical protein C4577_03555 [Candidatus Parcubacteria bacterium]
MGDVFVVCVIIVGLLLCCWNIVLTIQNRRRKADIEYFCKYLSEFSIKFNKLVVTVSNHSTTIWFLAENDHLSIAALSQIKQTIKQLEIEVQEFLNSMDDGSGYGESWKNGYRPDGSKIDDDE